MAAPSREKGKGFMFSSTHVAGLNSHVSCSVQCMVPASIRIALPLFSCARLLTKCSNLHIYERGGCFAPRMLEGGSFLHVSGEGHQNLALCSQDLEHGETWRLAHVRVWCAPQANQMARPIDLQSSQTFVCTPAPARYT